MINKGCFLLAAFCALALITGCERSTTEKEWRTSGEKVQREADGDITTVTLGDIDPDTPTSRMRRIRPLADHLADELGWDRSRVKVLIARSIEEISDMMADGRVDVFMDSSLPTLLVRRAAGTTVILESLVNGQRSYHSLIIASANSGVEELADLEGSTIALQERYSTSGYLLPASILIESGLEVVYTAGVGQNPPDGQIGFFFSGDEENTLAMIRKGMITAGALSSQDYEQLPDEVRGELAVLKKSPNVPRKLVSVRSGFDEALKSRLIDIMLTINDEDREEMVRKNGWNWEFSALDEKSHTGIDAVEDMITRTASVVLD